MIGWIEDCQRRGLRIFGQGQTVRATYYFNLDDWNLYDSSPAWRDATTGTREEKIRKLSDPGLRARMIADVDSRKLSTMTVGGDMGEHIYQGATNTPKHDELIGLTLAQIAERQGKHRAEVMIDLSIESDLQGTFLTRSVTGVNADDIEEILASPFVFPGVLGWRGTHEVPDDRIVHDRHDRVARARRGADDSRTGALQTELSACARGGGSGIAGSYAKAPRRTSSSTISIGCPSCLRGTTRKSSMTCRAASGAAYNARRATDGSWSTERSRSKTMSARTRHRVACCGTARAEERPSAPGTATDPARRTPAT